MKARYLPLLLAALLALPAAPLAAAPADAARLAGHWVLDAAASDDLEEVFEDKLRKRRARVPGGSSGGSPGGTRMDNGLETAQQRYWDRIREDKERRALKDLQRLGTAYPLLTADTLDIFARGSGFHFLYDELLPRAVRPNPGGRVYSASGAELVADTIGHTLAWWEDDTLVLETQPVYGGRYVERLRLAHGGAQLEYRIELDLRVLTEPVSVTRTFARDGG